MDKKFQAALKEAAEQAVSSDSLNDQKTDGESADSNSFVIAEATRDELDRRKHKTQSRKIWGRVLLTMVACGFTASYAIVVAIGLGWLEYSESQFAVPSVIAAGIIGTYGLAKIAVNYFFTD